MQVGGAQVPGSKAFKFGTGITFGIVMVAAIIGAVPVIGFLAIFLGPLAAVVGGGAGGWYAVNTAGVPENDTGGAAMLGGLVAALGNAVAAVIGIALAFVTSTVLNIGTAAAGGGDAVGSAGASIAGGIIGAVIGGGIGLVSGSIIALIFGVVGGIVAAKM